MRLFNTIIKQLSIAIFLFTYLSTNLSAASSAPSVWDVLRDHLILNHETNQPEVQEQIHWLVTHPSYLEQLAQSERYIYHIITEVRKRHLPGELALIPLIESAYDPFAYSGKGAAGLWQIMPVTGNDLGLKQDWWYDGRRSIGPSTNAALNYLDYLRNNYKGNWALAIAAYNAGEGTISKAMKNSGRANRAQFWNLHVPNETKAYVPRLLALAELIKYPEHYHVKLPDIPHVPYFEEVNIDSQIDLNQAAKLAGISYRELLKLNPGFNHWATTPYKPVTLLLPTDSVANFYHNLALTPKEQRVSWARYEVKSGDKLQDIARRYFTTIKLLRELNQLHSDNLKRGQRLLIPQSKSIATLKNQPQKVAKKPITKPLVVVSNHTLHTTKIAPKSNRSPQTYKVLHIVQGSDSFNSLAKKYHVNPEKIKEWNNLASTTPLHKNQQLIIWKTVQTS